jgi:signal transduction histidine kinase
MDLTVQYSSRVERLIAAGRAILAAFSLFAIWLDPSEPRKYAQAVYTLLALYLVYALVVGARVWSAPDSLARLRLASHVFDLAAFTVFMYFTEGPTSAFFFYFVFALVCATLRWQWQGTLWTAVASLAAFLALGAYAGEILRDPAFELNRFIIRGTYLAVVAVLLGYLGAHQARIRSEMSNLAAWTPGVPGDPRTVTHDVVQHVITTLGASRVVMAWEDPDEPWLNIVSWSEGRLDWTREPPGALQPMVAERLAGSDFLTTLHDGRPEPVLQAVPAGFVRCWPGEPFHPDLKARLGVGPVLALRLGGEEWDGRLLASGKRGMICDDLVLGGIVARQVTAHLEHLHLLRRLKQVAATEERMNLARDLHDGLLQSLTGIALILQSARSLLDSNPEVARDHLLDVQRMVAAQQRGLRGLVRHLTLGQSALIESESSLAGALEGLAIQVDAEWNVHVDVKTAGLATPLSGPLTLHVTHMVREALVNAVRHGRATFVRVEVWGGDDEVHVSVADNGRGFPFRGRYDHARLTELKLGPATLKERVAALRGSLVIDSSESGACVEIILPLARAAV